MNSKFKNVKILHLEPTDACNAACPQCAREWDSKFDKTNLHQLTVEKIKDLFSEKEIKQLDKMYMCGDYGDPAAGKHTLDIYRYFRSINPDITLGMNSNGGLRSKMWWQELAEIMNKPTDYVVFSIDGLEDTNHIYRVNVEWNKVIENAKSFINNGGPAHWDMLVFDHNEHQVDQCEQLARELGFKWFRAKVSRRFDFVPVNVDFLHPPKNWQDPHVTEGTIKCQALDEDGIYVSAEGKVFPCCYLGVTDLTLDKFDDVQKSWTSANPNYICKATCTLSNTNSTAFLNQWQREIELN